MLISLYFTPFTSVRETRVQNQGLGSRSAQRALFDLAHGRDRQNCLRSCSSQRQPSFKRRGGRVCVQAGNQQSRYRQTQQLPIFPLGMVALPGTTTPLNIFEARYRVLFNTLLAGDEGLEDGLVNEESPFCGSRQFGISMIDGNGAVAEVGTLLKIEQHKRLPDGQMVVMSRGIERYRLRKVIQKQPILIADVELFPAEEDTSQEARQLAADVVTIVKQLLELNVKMRKMKVKPEELNPPELTDLHPTKLSFFVASLLLENFRQQQELLICENTVKRLEIEKEILGSTLRYLSARFALQGAFAPSSPETEGKVET